MPRLCVRMNCLSENCTSFEGKKFYNSQKPFMTTPLPKNCRWTKLFYPITKRKKPKYYSVFSASKNLFLTVQIAVIESRNGKKIVKSKALHTMTSVRMHI